MNELQKQAIQNPRYIVVPAPSGKDIINFTKTAFVQSEPRPSNSWAPVTTVPQRTLAATPAPIPQKPSLTPVEAKKPVITELFKGKEPITLEKLQAAALAKQRQAEIGLEVFDLQEPYSNAAAKIDAPLITVETQELDELDDIVDDQPEFNYVCQEEIETQELVAADDLKALSQLGIIEQEEELLDLLTVEDHKEEITAQDLLVSEPSLPDVNTKTVAPEQSIPSPLQLPTLNLLNQGQGISSDAENEVFEKANLLEHTLASFGVQASVTDFTRGPAITRFEIQPAPGVKVAKIVNLSDDLALSMAATDIRIEAPIPGKAAVGIEIPNDQRTAVTLHEVVDTKVFTKHESKLAVALGVDIAGTPVIADLTKMPHLLIAGSTGSGKSVCINTLISSILLRATPDEVKFMMIDPKMVELSTFNGIPHLIAPVITDPRKATMALKWIINEMESRYSLFASAGAKNISAFNKLQLSENKAPLPLIVVLIDELADLMMVASKDVEDTICRLAQMARAAGIHLVIATQRPSVDVITGIIKANIPSRIAFAVSSQADSRTILDIAGAEKLLGRGDMLFNPIGLPKPHRVQGAFVSDEEVFRIVSHWKQQAKPEYETGIIDMNNANSQGPAEEEDELLAEAARLLVDTGQASVSMLQRRFRIGYNRAARLIDQLEDKGVVGPFEGSKPRAVLIDMLGWEQIFG